MASSVMPWETVKSTLQICLQQGKLPGREAHRGTKR